MATSQSFPKKKKAAVGFEWEQEFYDKIYQGELLERSLIVHASKDDLKAKFIRITLIVIGVLTAAQATIDQIVGGKNLLVSVIFTCLGIVTAILGGLLSTFKWDERTGRLHTLASETKAWLMDFQTTFKTEVNWAKDSSMLEELAKEALKSGDKRLQSLQKGASDLSIIPEKPKQIEYEN